MTTFLITFVACLLSSCVAIAAQLFAHHRFYQSQLKAQLEAQALAAGGDSDEAEGNKAIHVRSLLLTHFAGTPLRDLPFRSLCPGGAALDTLMDEYL